MSNKDDSNLTSLQKEINTTTDIMRNNITKTIDREEKIEQIEIKIDELAKKSSTFKTNTVHLRRKMCLKNYKVMTVVGIISIILLIIIVVIITNKYK